MSVRQCKFTCVKCGKRCSDRPELMSEDSVLCGDHEIDIVYDDTVKCQYCKKVSKASKTDYQRAAKFFGNIQEYRAKLVDDGIVTKEMIKNPIGNRAIVALAKARNDAMKKAKFEHEFTLRAMVNEDGTISLRLRDENIVLAKNVRTGAGLVSEYDFELGSAEFEDFEPKLRKNRKELKTALKTFLDKNKIKVSK